MTETQTAKSRNRESASRRQRSPARDSQRMFADILCAVDGTRASTAAVRMAACLAGPDGHLTLLAVTSVSGSGPYATARISPSRAKRVLDRAQSIADEAGVPATAVMDPGGPPVKVILERAAHHDLLAIGAPGTSRLGGMLIRGVTAAALSQFSTPMLVVRWPFTGSLHGRRLVVASDGQKDSDRIVELACRLGLSQKADVSLVHALGPESKMRPRRIQAQARTLQKAMPEAGEAWVEPGRAWKVILDAAKSTKAAIVVIGSRRLGGLRALGSISRRVVHDAPCSVLLLPPE